MEIDEPCGYEHSNNDYYEPPVRPPLRPYTSEKDLRFFVDSARGGLYDSMASYEHSNDDYEQQNEPPARLPFRPYAPEMDSRFYVGMARGSFSVSMASDENSSDDYEPPVRAKRYRSDQSCQHEQPAKEKKRIKGAETLLRRKKNKRNKIRRYNKSLYQFTEFNHFS